MKARLVNLGSSSPACKGKSSASRLSQATDSQCLLYPLNSDLTTLREQQHTAESDAQNLTSQTQTMLNLNLKLQSTVNKGQVKTIELDLRKMEAAQAVERLNITRVGSNRSG